MKVYEFLKEAAREENGVVFCSGQKEEFISYRELWSQVLRLALVLKEYGVSKNQVVILVLPNGIEFVTSFFAIQIIGAIPCAVYPPLRLKKLNEWKHLFNYQVSSTNAPFVIGDERLRPLVKPNSMFKFLSPENLAYDQPISIGEIETGDYAFIQFSSGTTGLPKAISITHEMVAANVVAIRESFPDPSDGQAHCTVSWLPLYHDMGLVGAMLTSIYAKAKLVLMRPEDFLARPMLWPEKISKYRGTVTVAPNFAFGLCVKRFKETPLDLSMLEVAMCGAEQVHRDTMDQFLHRFAPYGLKEEAITPVYGMAEATLAISFSELTKKPLYTDFDFEALTHSKQVRRGKGVSLASVGYPLPETSIAIRNRNHQDLGTNQLGEIWVKGAGIYKKNQWMRTGDQGFLFEGQLYLWGRVKDILIVHGKNIDPTYLELACRDITGIRPGKIAVVNDFQDNAQEKIIVFVESLSEDKQGLKDTIVAKILKETGIKVHQVELLHPGELPRTSSGKIQRSKCLNYFYQQQFGKKDRDFSDMTGLLIHSAKMKVSKLFKALR